MAAHGLAGGVTAAADSRIRDRREHGQTARSRKRPSTRYTAAANLLQIYDPPAKHHTLLGTVLFALFWVQPFFGLAHHFLFIKKHSRTAVSYVHIWYGRALFIMAIVNGGLGLHLAALLGNRTIVGEIAYGVVAGFVGLLYVCGASFGEWRRLEATKPRANGNVPGGE